MAGKIYTDIEALYGIREAIVKFVEDILTAQEDFAGVFAKINFQINSRIMQLKNAEEEWTGFIIRTQNEYEEEKNAAERNRGGKTDSFCCRKCGGCILLKIMGDETRCRKAGCNGVAVRVYNNSEYQIHKAKMEQLKIKIEDAKKKLQKLKNELLDTEKLRFQFSKEEERIRCILSVDSVVSADSVITFMDQSIEKMSDYNEVHISAEGFEKNSMADNREKGSIDKLLDLFKGEQIETNRDAKRMLEECGIVGVDFTGVPESYQFKIANSVVDMCEAYPELKGYIDSIYVGELRGGILASAGSSVRAKGFTTEIIISRSFFMAMDLEERLDHMHRTKLNGQRWLAGSGIEGVIKHEMAHLLHLKLISDSYDINSGELNYDKRRKIEQEYMDNVIVTDICDSSIYELGMEKRDIARNLSTYGSHDSGECFAEAMSEYETSDNPGPLCTLIHDNYVKYRNERSR